MVGIFGDYVLSCLHGDIVEIGAGESSIYLTFIAKKYGRRIYHCDIEYGKIINPMSISGYLSDDIEFLDDNPKIQEYEPSKRAFATRMASDDFFRKVKLTPIAFAFIDGDHNYPQVKRDFDNLVPHMVENGFILLHDTYPPTEEYLADNCCGTVYQLRQEVEKDPRFDCITLVRGTAMGVGLTIVRIRPQTEPYYKS